jgi:methylated-DNA-[protein]-cysteine S-methyltransferase
VREDPPDTAALLRANGLRSTPQRRAILAAFRGGPVEHLAADEVHARAAQAIPDLGRGTVYATLAEFTELGLLGAIGAAEPVRYETNVERHDHFRCRVCLRLFDVDLGLEPPRSVGGFSVERVEFRAEGVCEECRAYESGLDRGARAIRSRPTAPSGLEARGVAARALDTALGTIFIAATPAGVIRVAFEEDAEAGRLGELGRGRRGAVAARAHVDEAAAALESYLAGTAKTVACAVDWAALDPVAREALESVTRIPYGARRSYSDLGVDIGARPLGAAFGANPIAIVLPCHRVMRGQEVPEAFVGGAERRRWLLALEQTMILAE